MPISKFVLTPYLILPVLKYRLGHIAFLFVAGVFQKTDIYLPPPLSWLLGDL